MKTETVTEYIPEVGDDVIHVYTGTKGKIISMDGYNYIEFKWEPNHYNFELTKEIEDWSMLCWVISDNRWEVDL